MDQLSYLTNNHKDVQTVYHLTSFSIPTTMGNCIIQVLMDKLDDFSVWGKKDIFWQDMTTRRNSLLSCIL